MTNLKFKCWKDCILKGELIHFWFRYRPDEPISDLFDDSDLSWEDYKCAMLDWIEYCQGEPIPKEFKLQGWQTWGVYSNPIHYWIKYRPGEPIPEDMKIKGWQKTKGDCGKPIDYWIKYRPDEPMPEDLQQYDQSSSEESSSS